MPRFKLVDYSPRFLPIDLSRQLVPGTFEFALHHLLEHQIDLSHIESRYCNDEVGASAYEPRILLKIVLLAYARGILSSRGMEAACRDNVQFIALSGDAQPDHSTLTRFVSELGDAAGEVFTQVLLICDRQGLIGREMFAIDGVNCHRMRARPRAASAKTSCARPTRCTRRSSSCCASIAKEMPLGPSPSSSSARSVTLSACAGMPASSNDGMDSLRFVSAS
jgi:transposase